MSAKDLTRRLALLTKEAGLDGVVASGQEIELIRDLCGKDFLIVTPGVRITERRDDQKRTISPGEAIRRGATYVVLGRTVLSTERPKSSLEARGGPDKRCPISTIETVSSRSSALTLKRPRGCGSRRAMNGPSLRS